MCNGQLLLCGSMWCLPAVWLRSKCLTGQLLAHLYVGADIVDEPQQLCMPAAQHCRRRQARQLSAQRHQLLLCCCHEGGAGRGRHLDQLLAHRLTEPQRPCRQTAAHNTR